MKKIVATRAVVYAGRSYKAGDAFEALTPRDARLLVGIRKARYAEAEVSAPELAPPVRKSEPVKEIETAQKIEKDAPKAQSENKAVAAKRTKDGAKPKKGKTGKKNTYKTKVLVAENEG